MKQKYMVIIFLAFIFPSTIFISGALMETVEYIRKNDSANKKITRLFSAIEQRIIIDKFNENGLNEQLKINIEKAFNSGTYSCMNNESNWNPIYTKDVSLLNCNEIKNFDNPLYLSYKSNIITKNHKVEEVYFLFFPKSSFVEEANQMIISIYSKNKRKITKSFGTLSYDLVQKDLNDKSISSKECLNLAEQCQLKVSLKFLNPT
jgi:hypothetical protein